MMIIMEIRNVRLIKDINIPLEEILQVCDSPHTPKNWSKHSLMVCKLLMD